ncbi:MAG TPA: alanine racemase [Microbacteriaceae bacterium]|nr:alanine racemase [Microbacteriaceae bacterium]
MRTADIHLGAVRANVERMRQIAADVPLIAVVKADGYGHGAVPVARAALAAGADALGVADITEGLQLRRAGIPGRILAWLHEPGANFGEAIEADLELAVSNRDQLDAIVASATQLGTLARVHLKVDTGLNRGGARRAEWPALVAALCAATADGRVRLEGVFSHLANFSLDANRAQAVRFDEADAELRLRGLDPDWRHLAASEGVLTDPELRRFGMRVGIALYGLSPTGLPAANYGLTPVMTLRSRVSLVNDIPAGEGASYGHDWIADVPTRLALVPIGYADGLPRAASGRAEVSIGGQRFPVRGRIAMDQIIVDIADATVQPGDDVVIWGDPKRGEPSADEWAEWAGTIGYELVTKVGRRVAYRYLEDPA